MLEEAQGIPYLKFRRCRFLKRTIHPLKDLLALIDLYSFIKKNSIEIVHTHSSKAGILGRLAARLAGVKAVIHTVHGWSFNDYQLSFIRHLYLFLERFCAKFTSRIIVVSQRDRDKGLANGIGNQDKYVLIRYGINCREYKSSAKRDEVRKSLGLERSDLVVGMVACFKPQKAPLDFVKSAHAISKTFPAVRFVLIGDGALRAKITRLIKSIGLENKFILTGWRHDIPLILSSLDIFTLTSLWEGIPIAVLEAMAAGVPVVATDTGGIREVVLDGITGYLVKPSDTQAMQGRIAQLLENNSLRKGFAERSAQIIEGSEFSLDNMLKMTERLYLNLLGGI